MKYEKKLEAAGWKKYPYQLGDKYAPHAFYKSFNDCPQCQANKGKDKQVEIVPFLFPSGLSFQVNIYGEMENGQGIRLSQSSNDLETALEFVPGLLKIWEFAYAQNSLLKNENPVDKLKIPDY